MADDENNTRTRPCQKNKLHARVKRSRREGKKARKLLIALKCSSEETKASIPGFLINQTSQSHFFTFYFFSYFPSLFIARRSFRLPVSQPLVQHHFFHVQNSTQFLIYYRSLLDYNDPPFPPITHDSVL